MTTLTCTKPPVGWFCTREPNHEGPCAALPRPEQIAINDFVVCNATVGRAMLTRLRRAYVDLLCRYTGHLLWRVSGSQLVNPEGSLPLNVTICRRCGMSGYVRGDYWRS